MCDTCRAYVGPTMKKHAESACPLMKSLYCGMCACYGHTTKRCPDVAGTVLRQPQTIEQLLPTSVLETYQITSRTPLPGAATVEPEQPVLEILDHPKTIRATLLHNGLRLEGRVTENKRALQRFGDRKGMRVIFKAPPAVDED